MSRAPRHQSQRPSESPRASARKPDPSADGWDHMASSLFDEMDRRLGAMRQSWINAECSRVRALLEALDDVSAASVRLAALQQLADLEPALLAEEAELASLVRRAEALIDHCGAVARGDKRGASPKTGPRSRPRA